MIQTLMAKSASPLKKVKRKVGYSEKGGDGGRSNVVALGHNSSVTSEAVPEGAMKRMRIDDQSDVRIVNILSYNWSYSTV